MGKVSPFSHRLDLSSVDLYLQFSRSFLDDASVKLKF